MATGNRSRDYRAEHNARNARARAAGFRSYAEQRTHNQTRRMRREQERSEPATGRQVRFLHVLLRRADVAQEDRHGWAAEQLGHDVDSFNALTIDEASRLIDILSPHDERRHPTPAG